MMKMRFVCFINGAPRLRYALLIFAGHELGDGYAGIDVLLPFGIAAVDFAGNLENRGSVLAAARPEARRTELVMGMPPEPEDARRRAFMWAPTHCTPERRARSSEPVVSRP